MFQSWPWDSQVADKSNKKGCKKYLTVCERDVYFAGYFGRKDILRLPNKFLGKMCRSGWQ